MTDILNSYKLNNEEAIKFVASANGHLKNKLAINQGIPGQDIVTD